MSMFVQFASFSLPRTNHVTVTILKHAGISYRVVPYRTIRTVPYNGCTCLGSNSGSPNDTSNATVESGIILSHAVLIAG